MSKSSAELQEFFLEDPEAMRLLFSFRASSSEGCSAAFFEVNQYVISPLALINKVLQANGLEPVAIKMTGDNQIVGFCDYKL